MKYSCRRIVTPGAGDPIVIIGDSNVLRVRIDVDERDIGRITVGVLAFTVADAYPAKKFTGRVSQSVLI